jgi:hypothetical protein
MLRCGVMLVAESAETTHRSAGCVISTRKDDSPEVFLGSAASTGKSNRRLSSSKINRFIVEFSDAFSVWNMKYICDGSSCYKKP